MKQNQYGKNESKKTDRFHMRISENDKATIKSAAEKSGKSVSEFILSAAIRELMETGHG